MSEKSCETCRHYQPRGTGFIPNPHCALADWYYPTIGVPGCEYEPITPDEGEGDTDGETE